MKKRNLTPDEGVHDVIKRYFTNNPFGKFSVKRLAENLRLPLNENRQAIHSALDELISEEYIEPVSRDKFQLTKENMKGIKGRVVTITQFLIFVKCDEIEEDVVVETQNCPNVLIDDVVEVFVLPQKRRGRIEAVVGDVIERPRTKFVGVIDLLEHGDSGFVTADSRNMPHDIFVAKRDLLGAQDGEKVLVELTGWPEGSRSPVGRVVTVLGAVGDNDTEMHAILAEYGLPYHFEEAVERAADAISEKISAAEIKKRRDFRGVVTCTIDPKDAKDFDDAISIQKSKNGNWEIGVHIADVTHYVRENTIIESEAVERATSVYLVDRTVPMLPEKLSNGLCSLRPNEQKLCFSAVFEINEGGDVLDQWIGRTIIESQRRFTYEEAQEVIESGRGDFAEEVLTLDRIAKVLRAERFKSGSIAFERDEVKFNLDEKGKPIGIYFKEMKDANHLVEEFMLLANRKVAEFIGRKKQGQKSARTFVYRVHDRPNEEKYADFSKFAAKFGYILKAKGDRAIAKEMNKLLKDIKGKNEENLFSTLALRSMAKARYSTENIGHYGLAFDYYTHFTSPIRRYPDMMVHRLLQYYLDGGASASVDIYDPLCEHSSQREIIAAEAERASIKYKMVEYMGDKVGMDFEGHISGVTDWGIYVELNDSKIEGMVPLRDITEEVYNFDNENYRLVGSVSKRIITLGDPVEIKVVKADLKRKLLDFSLLSHVDLAEQTKFFFTNKVAPNSQRERSSRRANGLLKEEERRGRGRKRASAVNSSAKKKNKGRRTRSKRR